MDLKQHLTRQIAFSRGAFGPGSRQAGIIDHIRKEIGEVEQGDGDPREWVDLVILSLDGLWRSLDAGFGCRMPGPDLARRMCELIDEKQSMNELRTWPDWRTASPDKAIEHDRSGGKETGDESASNNN